MRILIIDDEDIVHHTLGSYLKDLGHHIDSSHDGYHGRRMVNSSHYDLVLLDIRMPGLDGLSLLSEIKEKLPHLPIVLISGHGSMKTVIEALRAGAFDYLMKPVQLLELDAVVEKVSKFKGMTSQNKRLEEAISTLQDFEGWTNQHPSLIGQSKFIGKLKQKIQKVVQSRCETILIEGETGTGKEVVAREIHSQSRGKAPFIGICCPTLNDTLAESLLFGHLQGSFTGATEDRVGYFEMADGGTLFLDEIGDLPLNVQAKLLRVLEERTFRPIGGNQEIYVDVQVIAATNRNLVHLIEEGRFRSDLYYRLNLIPLFLEPLRNRKEDILPLSKFFIQQFCKRRMIQEKQISEEVKALLENYAFPGNIRELRNLIERGIILSKDGQIHVDPSFLGEESKPLAMSSEFTFQEENFNNERNRIHRALSQEKWNIKKAAERLGIPYSTLRYKINKYEL